MVAAQQESHEDCEVFLDREWLPESMIILAIER